MAREVLFSDESFKGKLDWKPRIEAVKEKVSIFDVAELFNVGIKGEFDHNISCPFHGEDRHPSMRIYKDTNSYYCWACNRSGDVVDMAKEFLEEPFYAAVLHLAEKFGVELPDLEEYDDFPVQRKVPVPYEDLDEEDLIPLRKVYSIVETSLRSMTKDPRSLADAMERLDMVFWGLDPTEEIEVSNVKKFAQAASRKDVF